MGMPAWGGNCLNRMFESQWNKLNAIFKWFITFFFICYTWVIFRAENLPQALSMIWKSLNLRQLSISSQLIECFNTVEVQFVKALINNVGSLKVFAVENYINGFIIYIWIFIVMFIIMNIENNQRRKMSFHPLAMASLFTLEIFSLSGVSDFLYFNF